jgi:hypothetical protein
VKKAIIVAPLLLAVFALVGWQAAARAENAKAGAGGSTEAAILKLEDKIREALLKGDVATFQELYADDYLSVSALTGATSNKADLINNVKTGKLKYDSITLSDVKVKLFGSAAALVTAKAEVKGKFGDHDMSASYRPARLYANRGGKWQVVFFQSTKIAAQVPAG